MYVYTPCVLYNIITNNYNRIITRLYALMLMGLTLLVNTSIKDLLMIPKDQLMGSSVGTSGRQFYQIWRVLGSQYSNMISHLALIWLVVYLVVQKLLKRWSLRCLVVWLLNSIWLSRSSIIDVYLIQGNCSGFLYNKVGYIYFYLLWRHALQL